MGATTFAAVPCKYSIIRPCSNFRPVSNLKFLSKAIEKVAAMRLTDCLCGNNLNESLQTTFKKHHSCETALLRVQNDILKSIDNKQCVVLFLLALPAVFDTFHHKILLQRLRSRFGTRGKALAWLQSYLTDRSWSVQIVVLLLQFVRSDLVYPRGPCWVRCYISYTRPHWVTLYDGMIWNSIYMLMTLNCTHLQL